MSSNHEYLTRSCDRGHNYLRVTPSVRKLRFAAENVGELVDTCLNVKQVTELRDFLTHWLHSLEKNRE